METVFFIGLVLLGAALYFLPFLIALENKHRQSAPIFVLNLVFGWTLLGWVGALIWSLMRGPAAIPSATATPAPAPNPRMPCPHCAEPIMPAATLCPHCRQSLTPGWSHRAMPANTWPPRLGHETEAEYRARLGRLGIHP